MPCHRTAGILLFLLSWAVATPASAQIPTPSAADSGEPPSPAPAVAAPSAAPTLNDAQIRATLELMRNKGVISQTEYEEALQGHRPTAPPGGPPPPPITNRWGASLYGFIELDAIYDTTQSFNELAGNALLARPGTYAGEHGRTQFSVRNSRLGFKLKTPEFRHVTVSAQLEFDLLGNQPPGASEIQTVVNGTVRVRHAMLELRSPFLDLLLGQSWQLFGWQSYFHPATVAIQGVPGQIYSRAPQIRLSHTSKSDALTVELAAAVARSPQRDSTVPDGQAGVRMSINQWRDEHSTGSTGTAVDAAAVGISGALRYYTLAALSPAPPPATLSTLGWGVSVDAMLPIVAAARRRAWALTANGSFVRGTGIADLYTGLTGGVSFPGTPPLPAGYAAGSIDIDNGLALYQKGLYLATVDWQSFLVGLQLYLPPEGRLWLAGNFSQMDSANATEFLAANPKNPTMNTNHVFVQSRWADINLFWDVMPAVRLGAEYAWFWQLHDDNTQATNHRFQFSGFYIF